MQRPFAVTEWLQAWSDGDDVSLDTVKRAWRLAKLWLLLEQQGVTS